MKSRRAQLRANARQRRLRRVRVAKGLCPKCGARAEAGRRLCARHAAGNRAEKRRHDARRAAKGLCERCTRPVVRGKFCLRHYKADRTYHQTYQRDWWRARYRSDVAAGRCTRCRKRAARKHRTECARCAAARAA